MASAFTLPAFCSSPTPRQYPAARALLSFKVPFSGEPASPRVLRSLTSSSSCTEPVMLHATNSSFLRRGVVYARTSRVESSNESNTKKPAKGTRPSTKEKNPKRANSVATHGTKLDYAEILRYPIVSEAGIKNIVKNNTLVFAVDKRADKNVIKEAAKKIFEIKIKKVNTSILPDGTKKAFIMLTPDQSAGDVAKRIKAI